MVLKAIILFRSFCSSPEEAAKIEVIDPINVITNRAVGDHSSSGLDLTRR
jgi:hypothetical protein